MLSLYFLLFLSVHLISLYKEWFENIFGIQHFYECYENEGNFQTYCVDHIVLKLIQLFDSTNNFELERMEV